MNEYATLAEYYDAIQFDADYKSYAAMARRVFRRYGIRGGTVLEVACGTDSLTLELAKLGYDMIGCDLSPDMLSVAQRRLEGIEPQPLLICQDMAELELWGQIDGAVCALDSVNYLTDIRRLRRMFRRLAKAMRPGGVFLFDIKTVAWFEELDGVSSVWEEDGWFAAWQYAYDRRACRALNAIDLFLEREDGTYERHSELHEQRGYALETFRELLADAGFEVLDVYGDRKLNHYTTETGRLYIAARKGA